MVDNPYRTNLCLYFRRAGTQGQYGDDDRLRWICLLECRTLLDGDKMKIDLACWERGCPCYDQNEGVDVVRREWVSLEDHEIYEYADRFLYQHGSNYGIKSFGTAIEALLKEKNT